MQALQSFPEVPLEKLRWRCNLENFSFHTTDEVEPLDAIIGQERAQKALTLGVEIAKAGYNIYVCGATGTGRATAVQQLFAQRQGQGTPPSDLCYVYNFKNPDCPQLLLLPAGQGKALKKTMENLISTLKKDIPKTLADEGFQRRQEQNMRQAKRRERRLVKQLEKRLGPDFGLLWRDAEHNLEPELAPIIEGHLTALGELEERLEAGRFAAQDYQHVRERFEALSAECSNVFANIRRLRHEAQEAERTLERAMLHPIIHQAVSEASMAYTGTNVQQYFHEVETALNEDVERFHEPPLPPADKDAAPPLPHAYEEDDFHEYQINLIVDNADATGAPVIFETSPTYKNLFGAIEPAMEYGGVWRSDFMGIRAGAIHRAHGGYLIFNTVDALAEPVVWATLKRTLRYRQAEIQAFDQLALMPGTTLKPEPVPCDVKIIMLGNEELYYTLANDDEDFKRLFKVKAEFDTTLVRQPHSILQYAGFIQRICRDEGLHPFDRGAVAAVVEYGIRLAGRQNRLTARLDVIADVLREADYWTSKASAPVVTAAAVQQALAERLARLSLTEERLHEVIAQGLLLITTSGAVIGQVNGLAIYDMEEDYAFGCPMRITAETSMGDTGVVNIEREVNLGDATHNKGVLILSGYLRHAYAHDQPLVLTASLCVEQSYEGIVGDSAAAAEMYALLSSLAELPIDQGIAITGSMNQKGDLQPISGINEKIEGFFDVCRLQGLTGTQGVLLPTQNVDDLMLREDVIAAVATGQFHLYPIATIDEGLPILLSWPVGTRHADQTYPPDSVNGRIEARLRHFAERWYSLRHGSDMARSASTAADACPTCQHSAAAQAAALIHAAQASRPGLIEKVQALFRVSSPWSNRRRG